MQSLQVPIDMKRNGATRLVDESACLSREEVFVVGVFGGAGEKSTCAPFVTDVDVTRGDGSDEGEPGAVDECDVLQRSCPLS